ncbi:S-DNA-T family DNA segregation ATPase FtsK/SpoIIIE [Saccharothrix ecbatanensis]|uniref:S-DNA-T family DNA segregation ATPase FtsK/SpoIIIE n=1 Tax=Saccharothrix ecbatanensis TaxID=1105145 RepID=A0A7W9HEN5_9PSEU|nr:FtsK/SpoIIIE domain-containing protein [Saccharothrix ecbatanensis]MBB5800790.1 S-DNA-T family DNA segregation ATPase FtsK/SpoIIIE [Saccharothrix ecbatanensis]
MTSQGDLADGGGELVRQVLDGEFVSESKTVTTQGKSPLKIKAAVRSVVDLDVMIRVRSVITYRARNVPRDVVRLLWFLTRGSGRWIAKGWRWASYSDLRADARAARLSGDVQARRTAQELIRSDAKARWAKLGIFLRRVLVGAAAVTTLLVLLALMDAVLDRSAMPGWLRAVYSIRDALTAAVSAVLPWFPSLAVAGVVVAAVWEGRDRTPGAGWLTRPDRHDSDSWVDERMITRALAHLGIAPLNSFLKGGGELVYTVAARKDGDGTQAQIRLPLGVTAEMVSDRRKVLAANLGRASLETWPTTGEEDGLLDLWIADKGTLSGGAGDWPLLRDGTVDVFEGVPFGLTQRGLVVNAPLIGSNWLIGGRPGQGKTNLLRVLMVGAALDPTAELWVFVMGESPDFDPLAPRLSRYRMGMDDSVAADAVGALEDLLSEMERRGRALGEQSGRPPKVSRRLADNPRLGLHPIVLSIDECHELFQHPKHGKRAEELAVKLIKRGRKYGIVVLLATQSPTKDSIPKEITRNVACGVAFAVADHIANDGLLGSGKYRSGVRATELRMHTDRGTCVAVGVTHNSFELVRTFYLPFEDGIDEVTPVIARAMSDVASPRLTAGPAPKEVEATPVDHLHDIRSVIEGESRVRTQTVLARLVALNPDEYEPWTARDLRAALVGLGIRPRKSDGAMVVRFEDVADAIARRSHDDAGCGTSVDGRGETGSQGSFPAPSLDPLPSAEQRKRLSGRQTGPLVSGPATGRVPGSGGLVGGSLPTEGEAGPHDD